ncbi:MAG: Holliday junction branch migration protein RuvA [Cyanobacteria bacterium P01_A01_bin.135]
MLSYLRGTLVTIQKLGSGRVLLVLEVNHVGYELQILPRMASELPELGSEAQIHVHQQVREDQMLLYGFSSAAQRDLFRQLVAVSGIGPQLAVALLDTFAIAELVQAIVGGKTRLLAKTPGVGPKTAERICLELKTKLSEWREQAGMVAVPDAAPVGSVQEDVEMTLLALGYSPSEITRALQAVGQTKALSKTQDSEEWIREAIAWLSQ